MPRTVHRIPSRLAPAVRRGLAAGAAALLAACGGGVSVGIGIGIGGPDDARPSVALSVSPVEAAAGSTLSLSAAAADDVGVESVRFLRVEPDGQRSLLFTDGTRPFQGETVLPPAPAGRVVYEAEARDTAGQRSPRDAVTVTLRP